MNKFYIVEVMIFYKKIILSKDILLINKDIVNYLNNMKKLIFIIVKNIKLILNNVIIIH